MAVQSSMLFAGPAEVLSRFAERGRIKTLIVDDSPIFIEVVQGVLRLEPLIDVIARASNGPEAISLVAKLQPDLVVMDICMVPMDGLAAAARITRLFPKTTVILMSMEDSQELRKECRAAGAFAFLPKSSFANEFARTISELCLLAKCGAP